MLYYKKNRVGVCTWIAQLCPYVLFFFLFARFPSSIYFPDK